VMREAALARPGVRRALGIVLLTAAVALSAFPFGWLRSVVVSSIGMSPTLAPDDHVIVRGYGSPPARGDVVVYRSPLGDSLLVSRVVATAGETVEMDETGLFLDGCPVTVAAAGARDAAAAAPPDKVAAALSDKGATERDKGAAAPWEPGPAAPSGTNACTIAGNADCKPAGEGRACSVPRCSQPCAGTGCETADQAISQLIATEAIGEHCYVTRKAGSLSSLLFAARTVPEGHVFVLNDNRVDERDSRVYGPIPSGAVVGIASFVYYASDESGIRWDRINRRIS